LILSSEDDINIEHTFSFEPTTSESGGTNVAYTRDIANDAVETDSPSANEKEFEAEYWEQDEDSEEPFEEPSADSTEATPPSPEDKEVSAVVWWIVAFISLFQSLHVIPDRAIAWLIKFISILLNYCGQFSLKLKNVARALPRSLYLRNKRLFDFDSVNFYKYVVCPSCHCLYHFQDLYEKRGTQTIVKTCPTQQPGSSRCNSDLLKKVLYFLWKLQTVYIPIEGVLLW
jgi:hypothetical protein